jgi:hypothetical protein
VCSNEAFSVLGPLYESETLYVVTHPATASPARTLAGQTTQKHHGAWRSYELFGLLVLTYAWHLLRMCMHALSDHTDGANPSTAEGWSFLCHLISFFRYPVDFEYLFSKLQTFHFDSIANWIGYCCWTALLRHYTFCQSFVCLLSRSFFKL